MGHTTINGKLIGKQSSREVISRSAILILSGILVGTALAQGEMNGPAMYRICAGVIGILAFFALDLAAQRRQNRVLRKTLAAVDSTLARRLNRQVAQQTPKGPERRRSINTADSSYLPVTLAAREISVP